MVTERFGQPLFTFRTVRRIEEGIMYAERETGGFAKGETTEGKAKLDRGAGATEALGGRNRPGPQDFEEQSPVRVQLPAKIAIEIEMPATQATRELRCSGHTWTTRRTPPARVARTTSPPSAGACACPRR